jgi:hypothetical protein|tara:strand:- start:30 stop:164 length:135 start_codon:yes stop_codon:yes gene_type:complete
MIFSMAQHHKWSVSEIEAMMPFERDLYFSMLVNWIEEQNEQRKQ